MGELKTLANKALEELIKACLSLSKEPGDYDYSRIKPLLKVKNGKIKTLDVSGTDDNGWLAIKYILDIMSLLNALSEKKTNTIFRWPEIQPTLQQWIYVMDKESTIMKIHEEIIKNLKVDENNTTVNSSLNSNRPKKLSWEEIFSLTTLMSNKGREYAKKLYLVAHSDTYDYGYGKIIINLKMDAKKVHGS